MSQPSLARLLDMSEDDLQTYLGRELHRSSEKTMAAFVPAAAMASADLEVAAISDLTGFFKKLGKAFFAEIRCSDL